MVEIWRAGGPHSLATELAPSVEAEGWDGQVFMDSQSLAGDPYVLMGAWAAATERLKLATGVTNPLTRNLAVAAGGIATVQAISNGRAVLGIGRGDSALAYLGLAPVPTAAFGRAIETLQALLRGEEVGFAELDQGGGAPSAETLSLGARPEGARLRWLPEDLAKVPLDIAATGPRVIAMGARIAERVTFSVGAEPERIAWALGQARAAQGAAAVSYGAQVVVVCHRDPDTAMETACRMAPPLARFQVMQGGPAGRTGTARDSLEAVRAGYDMTNHGDVAAERRLTHGALDPDFVRAFAIVGPPDHCIERLQELRRLGIERFIIVGPGFYPVAWGEASGLFAREVIPALHAD